MPKINTASRSIQVKIVYYGPGLSGKTTNLKQLKKALSKDRVGEMMSLDTKGDRTLFFDWIPVKLGKIRGFDIKIQLYTVPGQIRYNKTRRQVLRGVDGVVFVADSQKAASEQNVYSFNNLRENLSLLNVDLEDLPLVIQCNKKDLPETMSTREMALLLNSEHIPFTEAIAFKGKGVSETLRLITRLALKKIQKYLDPDRINQLKSSDMPLDGDNLLQDIINDKDLIREIKETENSDENGKKIENLEIPEPSGEEKNAKASLGLKGESADNSGADSFEPEKEVEKDKDETTSRPVAASEQVESSSKSEKQQQEVEMKTKSFMEGKESVQRNINEQKIKENSVEGTAES
ncbi:MAG: GTP-binding protein, partial [Myxococcota bacterium]